MIGQRMGWRPWDVRRATFQDFAAAIEGWEIDAGVSPAPKQADLDRLDALMARYPD